MTKEEQRTVKVYAKAASSLISKGQKVAALDPAKAESKASINAKESLERAQADFVPADEALQALLAQPATKAA